MQEKQTAIADIMICQPAQMQDIWKNSQPIIKTGNNRNRKVTIIMERKTDGKKFKGYDKAGAGFLF